MTFRLLGVPDELRLEIEQGGLTTEAARLIIEASVQEAEALTQNALREIQTIIGPHGSISRIQAGGVRIDPGQGVGVFVDGVYKTQIQPNGTLIIGSNIQDPTYTTEVFFTIDSAYNGEEFGAGDYLIGDNSSGESNMKWDASEGKLEFRAGTTVTAYMDTDGELKVLAAEIGGWVIGTDSIKDAAGVVGILSTVTGGDDIRFYAGHVTPSSAPFRVTEAGALVASNATITGSITATSGTIGGWVIASDRFYKYSTGTTGIQFNSADASIYIGDLLGTFLWIDGANKRIRSSNFATGASGFQISGDTGDAEFNNITARGELKTFLLTSSNQMAVAGNILVSKDAGKLGAAVGSGDTTVNFGKAMTVGDWVKFQGPDTAGTASLEWMLVGSLVSGTTYNVTRNVDGSGANAWADDTPFVVIGQSGDSRIEIVAGATGSIQLITQGATWNTQTVQASMSTVDGAIVAGGGDVLIDNVGVKFKNQEGALFFQDTSGSFSNIFIYGSNADALVLYNAIGGKVVLMQTTTVAGGSLNLSYGEYGAIANVSKLSVGAGTGGAFFQMGVGLNIWSGRDGVTTIFNVDNYDIDFKIEGKNSSQVLYIDAGLDKATSFAWDGWQQMDHHTWTRTGNHTFTVSGDVTATYRKGTKVRYKDGGSYEYGVIASSSHAAGTTTVTLITNSDYAMAAATITDRYLSYTANPEGFPTAFNFSTTITYDGGSTNPTSNTVNVAKWRVNGSDVFFTITSTLVRGSGNRARTIYTIPITPSAISIMPGMDTIGTGALALAVAYAFTDGKIYYEKTMAANGDYYINGSFAL